MNNEPKDTKPTCNQIGKPAMPESATDRRELIQKLGRFAAYAAPFTALATTAKAATASGPQGAARR
jgi:hypothetical protein